MDLKKLREDKNLTIPEVSKVLGVSDATYMRIEKDPDRLSKKHFDTLMELFGVNILKNIANIDSAFGITNIPFFQDVVASMGAGMVLDYANPNAEKVAVDTKMLKDVFGIYCTKKLSMIKAEGDSMSPTIPNNATLLVQDTDIPDGCICVFILDDELYVKRVQKRPVLKFISDNKSYDDIYVKEGDVLKVIGRVVGFFKNV